MKWIRLMIIFTFIVSITLGCSDKDQQAADKEDKGKQKTEAQGSAENERVLTAHYLEEEVETMEEVEHATVMVQKQNAYVALELNTELNQELDEELKNKVVGMLRSTDPEIKDIYISSNLDFNTRMHGLARDIEKGLPAKEIGQSFEQTLRRVFPELKR
jgi:YhcN/YlaJ family sporulation lipoprotein